MFGALNRPHELVAVYGGTDKGWHDYAEVYRRHIGPLRLRSNVLLEIGVGGYALREIGGSLCFWRDYLPRSLIVGVDLHEKDVHLGKRVRFVQANQSDPADLDRVIATVGVPNIVIDDGSHVGRDVVATFEHLFPLMPPGSLYVIEDLHTSYWPDFGGALPAPEVSSIGLLHRLVDSAQASDPTFVWRVKHARPVPAFDDVQAVHICAGIAIIAKRRATWRDLLRNVADGPTSTAVMGRKLAHERVDRNDAV